MKIYTDASKMDNKVGIAYYMNDEEFGGGKRMEEGIAISTAELNAVKLAMEKAKEASFRNLLICTDSMVTCNILESSRKQKLMEPVVEQVYRLAKETRTKLLWIPSHCGILGNEKVDQMAKQAIIDGGDWYEEAKLGYREMIRKVEEKGMEKWQRWHEEKIEEGKGRKLNEAFSRVSKEYWFKKYRSLSGREIKLLNRMLCGHDYSAKYLKMWKKVESNMCGECEEVNEAKHIILKCKKYENQRQKLEFINKYNSVQDLIKKESEKNLKRLTDFIFENNIEL